MNIIATKATILMCLVLPFLQAATRNFRIGAGAWNQIAACFSYVLTAG